MELVKPHLAMKLDPLSDLPPLDLLPGFSVRSFMPGDEEAWNAIISESFERPADFESEIRAKVQYVPERVWFVLKDGSPVATATAWRIGKFGPDFGIIHMVGRLNTPSAKGSGRLATLAALHRLRFEGLKKAVLQTYDFRLPAICVYLGMGFVPLLVHENQRRRWKTVLTELNRPDLIVRFRGILAGPVLETADDP